MAAIIASKPSVSTQGTVRAIWKSLDTGRSQAMARGLSTAALVSIGMADLLVQYADARLSGLQAAVEAVGTILPPWLFMIID
ncbi:hypothetical protein HNR03_000237 [Pseudomonas sp. JAI111]|nr:hypothetical protein [Pseudomonas sp. JAI111]MCS3835657.1 hypothetical protein [Pseudomonas sp. JAI111]